MKKIINILSVIGLSSLTSLSVISCSKTPHLTSIQQKTDIVNAINQYENNNLKDDKLNNLSINDITNVNYMSYKNNQITYDLEFKNYLQSKNIISNKYQSLNPEIKGSFNLQNNKITNNKLSLLENLNLDYKNLLMKSTLLVGNTNDFIAIFDASDWRDVSERIWYKHYPAEYINSFGTTSPNINLTDNDWEKDILPSLVKKYNLDAVKDGYSFLMHIVNKKVVYANINKNGTTNMPYVDSAEHIKNNLYKIDENNFQFILSKPLLLELKDMFNYQSNLWTDIQIQNLIKDKMWLTNCVINDAIKNLKLLFNNQTNLKIINQLLSDDNHDNFVINIINGVAPIA